MQHICNTQEIFDLMKKAPTEEEKTLINRAYLFAEQAHEGQKRTSGDPYIIHVFATAKNLARYEMDATTIAAGLMHDVLEDTAVPEEEMEKEFGSEITSLIQGVTKLGELKYRGNARHVESLRKFFVAVAKDFRVVMIKLADRLHNLQTLSFVKPEKQRRIALESIEIYAPLANRLGIGKLKGELEDEAFPYAFPKEYEFVKKLLDEKTSITQKNLEQIKEKVAKELAVQQVKTIKIDYRIKHTYSLFKKMQKFNMDIEKINDIMALRIITHTVEDCYRILGIIHGLWRPLPGTIKDYIALPKLNGYQSLHTCVFTGDGSIVEIQIRTAEMHGRAEYGIASHFAYKERTQNTDKREDKSFKWVDTLKDLEHEVIDHNRFVDGIKSDFLTNRIFIFTPKGDVIDLPEDSSPIDFAYAVHSEIGNKTTSAKINGKMAPLTTKLKSGDIVEIFTNKNGQPASKWLDAAKTNLARKHINAHLRENSLLSKFLSFGKN